jgi:septal ring factor EnvC (AmiA/AmiB activator)
MNRTEFIIATAIILFAAFMLGWFASWLIHRLSRVTRAEMGELESMAQQLHDAEEARDSAVDQLEEREAELVERLSRTAAELRAARDELRETHAEIEELRGYIKQKLGKES